MRDFLKSRLAQGTATSRYPKELPVLPERFRGRPVIDGEPPLDLGACLFSPEEAASGDGRTVRFTRDHRMASRTREGLVVADEERELAVALDDKMRKLLGRSLRLRSVVCGSCGGCEAELVALGNVVFDLGRFGVQFVASPRHADGIVITGFVNENMREALLKTWEAVPDPRIVIAVGACAASGGPFAGTGEMRGIPMEIPVDLWVPGCPPHPFTLLDGLLRLLGRLDER